MKNGKKGFTLIELLISIAILSILASSIRPTYVGIINKTKEAALKNNLFLIREALDSYYLDNIDNKNNNSFPKTLDELVHGRNQYLRYIPVDPMTDREEWYLVYNERGEISDIQSLSTDEGSNKKKYSEW